MKYFKLIFRMTGFWFQGTDLLNPSELMIHGVTVRREFSWTVTWSSIGGGGGGFGGDEEAPPIMELTQKSLTG